MRIAKSDDARHLVFCPRCEESKARDEFTTDRRRKAGIKVWCKACCRVAQKAWRENNPDAARKIDERYRTSEHGAAHRAEQRKAYAPVQREAKLRNAYGMTAADYDLMVAVQANRCAGCTREALPDQPLQVDHNHTTGEVRGLLCGSCNRAVGLLGDNAETLLRLADYLEGAS